MKKLSIILACALVALISCTKSKEVHPEIGDGNDEIITVGMKDVHLKYTRTDHAELSRVLFHYSLAEVQQFEVAEMTKRESFFELTLNDLLSDTLYHYYYELFPNSGDAFNTSQKTFHTQAFDQPQPPTPPVAELPTVVTTEVSEITTNSAICGGEVTNDGGAEVTERGICWSLNVNPTLDDNHIGVGSGIGVFVATMDGLEANATYHVRAYAINEVGIAYGLDKEFTTLSGGSSSAPEGAINGLFTINENGDQVYFSQGNLQYQASTNTWRFANSQWDYVGGIDDTGNDFGSVYENGIKCDNSLLSETYDGWIDLFGWGTSGYNHNSAAYQPWASSTHYWQYYAYGGSSYNLYDQTGQADWGYNAIANGGNQAGFSWRTPTNDEWGYLFNTRADAASKKGLGNVDGVNGLILLPDDWTLPDGLSFTPDLSGLTNIYSENQWVLMEANGAIFFPAAGTREGLLLYSVGTGGNYWSSSYSNIFDAYNLIFGSSTTLIPQCDGTRLQGLSVRLVQDAK